MLAIVILRSVSSSYTIHPCPTTSSYSGMLQPKVPAPPKRCTSSAQWRSQGSLQYYPIYGLWGAIYSERWGDPWHSPLWNSSALMTLQLLYDCYFQLSTLDLRLTRCYITMKMYPCEVKWLEQAMQDITMARIIIGWPTLWHLHCGWQ